MQERKSSNIRYFRAPTRLSRLVERPGGVWRPKAVADAERLVESMRDAYVSALEELIADLQCVQSDRSLAVPAKLDRFERTADRIITVAGAFGYTALAEAAMRLCDLVRGLDGCTGAAIEIVAVPIDAIRLLAPRAEMQSEIQTSRLLAELQALLDHLGIATPAPVEVSP